MWVFDLICLLFSEFRQEGIKTTRWQLSFTFGGQSQGLAPWVLPPSWKAPSENTTQGIKAQTGELGKDGYSEAAFRDQVEKGCGHPASPGGSTRTKGTWGNLSAECPPVCSGVSSLADVLFPTLTPKQAVFQLLRMKKLFLKSRPEKEVDSLWSSG